MRLKNAQVTEFRSVWDSTSFDLDDITCLVGKNEAGKTAILQALYRLNPIIPGDGEFDPIDDYPRVAVSDYEEEVENDERTPAIVARATFELDDEDVKEVADVYGPHALPDATITLSKGYATGEAGCTLFVSVPVDLEAVTRYALTSQALPQRFVDECEPHIGRPATLSRFLENRAKNNTALANEKRAAAGQAADDASKASLLEDARALDETEPVKALRSRLEELQKPKLGLRIWNTLLRKRCPKFVYFDSYYQMTGQANVQGLKKRQTADDLRKSDHPLLGLIALAGLDLDQLIKAGRTQVLKNKLQGASNRLSGRILKYWSQNRHLRMNFDVRTARPLDPPEMQSGMNIWGEVYDQKHLVSTGLGTRSAGFVWFFSFLAWYSALKKEREPLVLLLDEPGLSLHGKAQADLLRYFDEEIATNPNHQLVYTTHSPFMVDSNRFDRVRIVQNRSIDADEELPRKQQGTKVFIDVLKAGADSLFPLQGALGYEIHQTLFVGRNCLIVEGVSDLLYLQTLSGVLSGLGRTALDDRWTITPVGGSGKIPTFVSLIGSQKNLNLATLVDYQNSDAQLIQDLYKKKLIAKSKVLTYADFTAKPESDVEDMIDASFYLKLVNAEYGVKLKVGDLKSKAGRMVVRLKEYFDANPPPGGARYNHYRPARLLSEKPGTWKIPKATLDRFEDAFKKLNGLLPASP